MPSQVHAGFLSSLLGSSASASMDGSTVPEVSKNSQNMTLPEANAFPMSTAKNNVDSNAVVVLDGSNTALVPSVTPGGSDTNDDTEGSDSDHISFYTVHAGDTWSWIAAHAGTDPVSVNTILWANDKKSTDKLVAGEVLLIPPMSGLEYEVKKGDTCQSIAKTYKVDASDISDYNDLGTKCTIAVGDGIFIPNAQMPTVTTKPVVKSSGASVIKNSQVAAGQSSNVLSGYYIDPVPGYRLSQGIHDNNAVDLAIAPGTPIHAAADGVVTLAKTGYNGGFGNVVIISHPNGTQTLYAHQSKLNTTTGATVKQGQVIGYVGTTGHSTGPHLHFEVHGAHNPGADNSWAK